MHKSFWIYILLLQVIILQCQNARSAGKVSVEYKGEGFHNYYYQHNEESEKTLFWISFWGLGEFYFTPNGKYMAMHELQRMGVMSPVMLFKVSDPGKLTLVYQTPANFDCEESLLDYSLGTVNDEFVEIGVHPSKEENSKNVTGNAEGFTYKVYWNKLSPTSCSYYDSTDPRHLKYK